jgi:hypothetical protein
MGEVPTFTVRMLPTDAATDDRYVENTIRAARDESWSGMVCARHPPRAKQLQPGGFKWEGEAREWIARKSAAWLTEFESGGNG